MDDLNSLLPDRPATQEHDSDCGPPKAQPPASVLRDGIGHRLFKAVGAGFRNRMLHEMRQAGIAEIFPGAAPVLLHLREDDGLTLSELARRSELENSTLTPLVDELERHGLATRRRDTRDRRVVRLYLTPKGQEQEARIRTILLEIQTQMLHGIADDDLATMHRVLTQMSANLTASAGPADGP